MMLQSHCLSQNTLLRTRGAYCDGIPSSVTGSEPSPTSVGATEGGRGQVASAPSSLSRSSMGGDEVLGETEDEVAEYGGIIRWWQHCRAE